MTQYDMLKKKFCYRFLHKKCITLLYFSLGGALGTDVALWRSNSRGLLR